ncbi:MAG TPA: sulfatase [Verrucomicrobiales bacterium]|nr:sulfatase [Verrucomicrobiales bacterium]
MRRHALLRSSALLFALLTAGIAAPAQEFSQDPSRPNILWIIVEDMSANFGCYGEKTIATPHVDRLAAEGIRFTNAIVTAPVCSASRSALITGRYQTAIGAHHHRSGRGKQKIVLPDGVQTVPELLRAAGYLCLNLDAADFLRDADQSAANPRVATAKTDYNFEWDASLYGSTHWTRREENQPFFIQVQLHGGKYRGHGSGGQWPSRVRRELGAATPEENVVLPPYLPNEAVLIRDWAQYLDTVRYTDHEVGLILERLREAGELERTCVFFITDHGVSHVRNKQFCYEGGVHIPLIVRGPGLPAGAVRQDPVEHIDLAAASLALAGLPIPTGMHGRNILDAGYQPREFSFSARDRCDETVDRIRCVRSERFKYIRNFYPDRPYLQPNQYKDAKPIVQTMRALHKAQRLNAAQSLIMADSRPEEELYDLEADPFELNNLAAGAGHADQLDRMRRALEEWIATSPDLGREPEPESLYDSDMEVYLGRRGTPAYLSLSENIALMKRWAAEGK